MASKAAAEAALPGKRHRLSPQRPASSALNPTSIVWYRDFDLRTHDHQPLTHAALLGPAVPVFIWPPKHERGLMTLGGAAQAWLEESLDSLDHSLIALGSRLILRGCEGQHVPGGAASGAGGYLASQLMLLADQCGATRVFYHRAYTPDGSREEDGVRSALAQRGVEAVGLPGHLLYEPSAVDMGAGYSGGHWGTLMPFLRACERSSAAPPLPLPPPSNVAAPPQWPASAPLSSLALAPPPIDEHGRKKQRWATKIMLHWRVGEAAALETMSAFVGGGLARYESDRSRADQRGSVSTLSPYIRFGQLSVRQLYHAVRAAGLEREVTKTFSRRLHWRDLAYYQLSCFPDMSSQPIRAHYAAHRWSGDAHMLKAWQRGMTGYPMVDAGMRCLWSCGWMHQSVRMVVASFLVEYESRLKIRTLLGHELNRFDRYLGISWVEGLRWFHNTLVDADVAINAMMWQARAC